MANYGPFGPGFAGSPGLSQSAGGAFDISGYPTATPLINSDMVKKSFATMVQYLLPRGDATLLGLSARVKEETAVQIEHGFYAKVLIFPALQLASTVAAANTTTFTVITGNGAQAIPGGLYRYVGTWNPSTSTMGTPDTAMTGEVIQVTSVSTDTVTVTRDIGNVGAGNLTASGVYTVSGTAAGLFVYIGNAFADASTRPNSVLTKEVRVVNYTQIFRNAWAVSGTIAAIQNLVGDTNVAKSRGECAQYHAKDIEASMIFGVGNSSATLSGGASSGYAGRTMHGIINQIKLSQSANLFLPGNSSSNNVTYANSGVASTPGGSTTPTAGALSMNDFELWINNCFDMAYDPMSAMERVVFVGRTSHMILNRLGALNANYFIENGKTEWGLRFSRLHLTRGDVIIIEHPLFNTNPFWQTLVLAVDIAAISVAYLTGRKTKSEEYNQAGTAVDNAIDAVGGSLLSELTVLNKNPAGSGIMTNVQKAVKPDGTLYS